MVYIFNICSLLCNQTTALISGAWLDLRLLLVLADSCLFVYLPE